MTEKHKNKKSNESVDRTQPTPPRAETYHFIFINGIQNSRDDLIESKNRIELLIRKIVPTHIKVEVEAVYNRSYGTMQDSWEASKQISALILQTAVMRKDYTKYIPALQIAFENGVAGLPPLHDNSETEDNRDFLEYLLTINNEQQQKSDDQKKKYELFLKREFAKWSIGAPLKTARSEKEIQAEPFLSVSGHEHLRNILQGVAIQGESEQKDLLELEKCVSRALKTEDGQSKTKVVLIGHSQGCLFIERLFQKRKEWRKVVRTIELASPWLNPKASNTVFITSNNDIISIIPGMIRGYKTAVDHIEFPSGKTGRIDAHSLFDTYLAVQPACLKTSSSKHSCCGPTAFADAMRHLGLMTADYHDNAAIDSQANVSLQWKHPEIPDSDLIAEIKDYMRHGAVERLLNEASITSVGIAYKIVNGERTKQLCLRFTVEQKLCYNALQYSGTTAIPRHIEINGKSIPTDVVECRYGIQVKDVTEELHKIQSQPMLNRNAYANPFAPGMSIGHKSLGAGTAGCIVYDSQTGEPYILSNHHVFHGMHSIGDEIIQPGAGEGNPHDYNVIGNLVRSCLNETVDAAIASIKHRRFTTEIVDLNVSVQRVGEPELGDLVVKSGKTTGVTYGVVDRIHVIAKVFYPGFGQKRMECFDIRPTSKFPTVDGEITKAGDSGSAWIYANEDGTATDIMVGLHFAGVDGYDPEMSLACYASSVFKNLGVLPSVPARMTAR